MIALALVTLLLLSFGLLLVQGKSDKRLDDIEEAIDYIDKTSDLNDIDAIQNMNVELQIELLLALEKGNIEGAKTQIIDILSNHFSMSNEAIEDGMASEEDKEIVSKIETLAKEYVSFKEITKE